MGILGAANIARKNWKAIRFAENATLTAVASREPSRAKEGSPRSVGVPISHSSGRVRLTTTF